MEVSIQSLTAAFIISVIPIVAIWIALLHTTGIWSDLVPDYRKYYMTLDAYVLDYFFVVFYVLGFLFLARHFKLANRPRWQLLLAFLVWVAVLDMGVAALVNGLPTQGRYVSFFRAWAKKAGWRAIIWDFIYISAIVAIACYLPASLVSSYPFWIIVSFAMIIGLIVVY